MYSPTHFGVGESSFAAGQLHSKLNLRILSSKLNVSMHKGVSMRGGPGVLYPGKPISLRVFYPGASITPELPNSLEVHMIQPGGPHQLNNASYPFPTRPPTSQLDWGTR